MQLLISDGSTGDDGDGPETVTVSHSSPSGMTSTNRCFPSIQLLPLLCVCLGWDSSFTLLEMLENSSIFHFMQIIPRILHLVVGGGDFHLKYDKNVVPLQRVIIIITEQLLFTSSSTSPSPPLSDVWSSQVITLLLQELQQQHPQTIRDCVYISCQPPQDNHRLHSSLS